MNIGSLIPTYPGSAIYIHPLFDMFLISLEEKGMKIYIKSERKLVEDQYAALGSVEAQRSFTEERTKAVLVISQVMNENCPNLA